MFVHQFRGRSVFVPWSFRPATHVHDRVTYMTTSQSCVGDITAQERGRLNVSFRIVQIDSLRKLFCLVSWNVKHPTIHNERDLYAYVKYDGPNVYSAMKQIANKLTNKLVKFNQFIFVSTNLFLECTVWRGGAMPGCLESILQKHRQRKKRENVRVKETNRMKQFLANYVDCTNDHYVF